MHWMEYIIFICWIEIFSLFEQLEPDMFMANARGVDLIGSMPIDKASGAFSHTV